MLRRTGLTLDRSMQKEPPFPWFAVGILLACNLTEPIVIAVLFPMAPFMVSEWVPRDEVGTWAGMLASAYNLTSIFAGVFWGRLSDKLGRVPCIVAVICGSAFSMVVFGLSSSLMHAVLARCLGGLFSGMGGLVTAAMRDLTTESQRSTAVSSISFAYGVGFSIGPALGGFLQRPADHFPLLCGMLFDTFPYLLPCVVVACLILISGLGLLWLPKPKSAEAPTAHADCAANTARAASSAALSAASSAASSAVSPPPPNENPPVEASEEGDGRRLLAGGQVARLGRVCRLPPVVLLLLAYLFMNFASIGSMEVYPLYLMRNDSSGLGLPPAGLGEVMLPQSFVIMCMPLVYPMLSRRFGHKGCYYIGAASLTLFSLCLPLLRFVKEQPSFLWTALMALSAVRGTVGPLIFPAMIIIVNEAVENDVGFWNGVHVPCHPESHSCTECDASGALGCLLC